MNPINHVAIIMDGNGRWGLKYKKSRNAGHKAGLNTVEKIIRETIKNKLKKKDISEDEEKKYEKDIQVLTDNHIKIIDDKVIAKEKEIMTI